jgi:hypothetical protein
MSARNERVSTESHRAGGDNGADPAKVPNERISRYSAQQAVHATL